MTIVERFARGGFRKRRSQPDGAIHHDLPADRLPQTNDSERTQITGATQPLASCSTKSTAQTARRAGASINASSAEIIHDRSAPVAATQPQSATHRSRKPHSAGQSPKRPTTGPRLLHRRIADAARAPSRSTSGSDRRPQSFTADTSEANMESNWRNERTPPTFARGQRDVSAPVMMGASLAGAFVRQQSLARFAQ